MTTLFIIIDKNFGFFYPHLHINCVAFAYKIIDTAGRKKNEAFAYKIYRHLQQCTLPRYFLNDLIQTLCVAKEIRTGQRLDTNQYIPHVQCILFLQKSTRDDVINPDCHPTCSWVSNKRVCSGFF